jgi:hypothetical protein
MIVECVNPTQTQRTARESGRFFFPSRTAQAVGALGGVPVPGTSSVRRTAKTITRHDIHSASYNLLVHARNHIGPIAVE